MSDLVIAACDFYWHSMHGSLPKVNPPCLKHHSNQGEMIGEWFQVLLHTAPPTYDDCVSVLRSVVTPLQFDPFLPTTESTMQALSERWGNVLHQSKDVYVHPYVIHDSPHKTNRINLALTRKHSFDITWIMNDNIIVGVLLICDIDSEKQIGLIVGGDVSHTRTYLADPRTQSEYGPFVLHEQSVPTDFKLIDYMIEIKDMIDIIVEADVIRGILHEVSNERQTKCDANWLSKDTTWRDLDPTTVPMNMLPAEAFRMRTFEGSTFPEDLAMHVKYVYVDSPQDAYSGWSTNLRDALHYYESYLPLYNHYVRPSEWLSFLDRFANGIPFVFREYPPEQVIPVHLVPCPTTVSFRFTGQQIESMISELRVMYEWMSTLMLK